MLFSASTGKSRSSWLDRLRTAKGFPHHGITDLDNFLRNPNSSSHDHTPHPHPHPHPNPNPNSFSTKHNHDKQFFTIVTDVLHDLFNFGTHSAKLTKSARKQPNPRICACPTNSNNNAPSDKVTLLRTGDSNSGVEGVKVLGKLENDGEGVDRDAHLAGFSRTEVTVIDTSYEVWKFEKLLYRKKNVWKVREKKGKSEIMRNRKKRKAIGVAEEEDQHGGRKRKGDVEVGRAEEYQLPENELQVNRSVEERTSIKVGKTAEKKQTDLKLEDGRSSVILVKSIHNGKKDGSGSGLCRSSLKLKPKKP